MNEMMVSVILLQAMLSYPGDSLHPWLMIHLIRVGKAIANFTFAAPLMNPDSSSSQNTKRSSSVLKCTLNLLKLC